MNVKFWRAGFGLRLAMTCVMREGPDSFNMLAPACGSWCLVSRGTSQRCAVNPDGRAGLDYVLEGNLTISRWGCGMLDHMTMCYSFPGYKCTSPGLRLVLLMVLILAVHSIFVLEQPRGSEQTLPYNRRFSWFVNQVCYVARLHP